jgi:hypothetical protein
LQQLHWLKSRQEEGRKVVLVIGMQAPVGMRFKDNLIITDFSQKVTIDTFSSSAIDKRGVAEFIMSSCLEEVA